MSGARRILANTAYRLLADVGSKLASIAFYVVMARELGAKEFGVFTFGLAFVILTTTLGNFGQDSVLTREVARDHTLLDRYFFNTLALKTGLSTLSLALAERRLDLADTEDKRAKAGQRLRVIERDERCRVSDEH